LTFSPDSDTIEYILTPEEMVELEKTNRGFDISKFKDRDGEECSLQKSSIATEDAIWLGMDNPDIKEFFPMPRDTDESWFKIGKEELQGLRKRPQNEIHAFSRMHLTREQVANLLPFLIKFVETGELHEQG